MKQLKPFVVAIVTALVSGSVFAESLKYSDFTPGQIAEFKALSRTYTNAKGDTLEVVFATVENDEPTLFDPEEFTITGYFELAEGWDSYEFDASSLDMSDANKVGFSTTEDDCDNPGCSNYQVDFVFKKSKGSYSSNVAMTVTVDAEDLSSTYEENKDELSEKQLTKLLDKGCKDLYGKDAWLDSFVDDYKHSVYCHYERSSVLK